MDETLFIDCYGQSEVGPQRDHNEDNFLVAGLARTLLVQQTSLASDDDAPLIGDVSGTLLVVADGMGGHFGGERASRIALSSLMGQLLSSTQAVARVPDGAAEGFEADLIEAFRQCQEAVRADAREDLERRKGMGTTLTMSYVLWPRMWVVHAGDTRCYLFRRGELRQVTEDHTMARLLVARGRLDPSEVKGHELDEVLANAIVALDEADVTPAMYREPLQDGDAILLCTDGLTKHASDDQIAALLATSESAEAAATALVNTAIAGGGSDNVTVVVGRFRVGRLSEPGPRESGPIRPTQIQSPPDDDLPLAGSPPDESPSEEASSEESPPPTSPSEESLSEESPPPKSSSAESAPAESPPAESPPPEPPPSTPTE